MAVTRELQQVKPKGKARIEGGGCEDENIDEKNSTALANKSSNFTFPQSFKSLLSQPFPLWNNIEEVVECCLPEWAPTQRGRVIQNLLRFLELKVLMEDYKANDLLSPTRVVGLAWRALVLETRLYRHVIAKMQAYHGRPKRMMHFSVVRNVGSTSYIQRLERTQALFHVYYNDTMMSSLVNDSSSFTETSTLTDYLGKNHWGTTGTYSSYEKMSRCSYNPNPNPAKERRKEKPHPLNVLANLFCYDLSLARCLCQDIVRDTLMTCEDSTVSSSSSTYDDYLAEEEDIIVRNYADGDPDEMLEEEQKETLSTSSARNVETKFIMDSYGRSYPLDLQHV